MRVYFSSYRLLWLRENFLKLRLILTPFFDLRWPLVTLRVILPVGGTPLLLGGVGKSGDGWFGCHKDGVLGYGSWTSVPYKTAQQNKVSLPSSARGPLMRKA